MPPAACPTMNEESTLHEITAAILDDIRRICPCDR